MRGLRLVCSSTRWYAALTTLSALLVWPSASSAQSGPRRITAYGAPLYLEELSLSPAQSVTFQTAGTTSGVDPIMHLLRLDAGGWTQVAFHDNYAALDPRIVYQNTTGATQQYLLVVRSKNEVFGLSTLYRNGSPQDPPIPVGGQVVPATALGFGASDELITRHQPGGSRAHALLTLTDASGFTIGKASVSNGAGGSAIIPTAGTGIVSFVIGTSWLRSGAIYDTPQPGSLELYGNDLGTDIGFDGDSDAVGNAVETELGTCKKAGTCAHPGYKSWDSDRDGLTDAEELWGVVGTAPDGSDDVVFGRWGADPTVKDAFVEVDYAYDYGGAVPPGANPFQVLHDTPSALNLTPSVPSLSAWVDAVRAPYLAAPASHIRNVDPSRDGVSIHLDLGVESSGADEAKFGDFPNASHRCVLRDVIVTFEAEVTGEIWATVNGATTPHLDVTGLPPESAALVLGAEINYLDAGVEAWRLEQDLSTSSTSDWLLRLRSDGECQPFTFALDHDGTDPTIADKLHFAWESHDALKYRNRSPYTRELDSVRRTRFRYAVATTGGQAQADRFNVNLSPDNFAHELGHTFGLEHWGRKEWGVGTDQGRLTCLPHYRSIMDYTHAPTLPLTFAHEVGLRYNPARANEGLPFGSVGAALDFTAPGRWTFTASPWFFEASPNTIDLDRDGLWPSSSKVRAWPMIVDGGNCVAFLEGWQPLTLDPADRSTDLVRVDTRLFALWSSGSAMRVQSALLGAAGNKSCTGSANPRGATPCLTWTAPATFRTASHVGFSAYRVGLQIFVATTLTNGILDVRRYNIHPTTFTLSEVLPRWTSSSSDLTAMSDSPPELTTLHSSARNGVLALVYRSRELDRFYFRTIDPATNTWSTPIQVSDINGLPLSGATSPAALAWPGPEYSTWPNSDRRTFAVFPAGGTHPECRLYVFDPTAADQWRRLNDPVLSGLVCRRQPSLAFRFARTTLGLPDVNATGHLMIAHAIANHQEHTARVAFSDVFDRWTSPPATAFAMTMSTAYWGSPDSLLSANGNLALYSDRNVDNVFGFAAWRVDDWIGPLFFPHGDGAPDFTYGANSDFRVMEDETCRFLRFSAATFDAGEVCGAIDVMD